MLFNYFLSANVFKDDILTTMWSEKVSLQLWCRMILSGCFNGLKLKLGFWKQ